MSFIINPSRYAAGSAAFTPNDITSMTVLQWQDPTVGVTASPTLVSDWDDQALSADLAQASGTLQPSTGTRTIGGVNVIDSQNKVMGIASAHNIVGDFTMMFVIEIDGFSSGNGLFGGGSLANRILMASSTLCRLRINSVNYTVTLPSAISLGTPYIVLIRRVSGTLEVKFGGSSNAGSLAGGSDNLLQCYVGGYQDLVSGTTVAAYGDIVVGDDSISDADANSLANAWVTKYTTPTWGDI